jgi:16S rRNA (guanine966-N2)-methyltransferase
MRIVAGLYRGRALLVPKGRDLRPTSDKVRGAIFNALQSREAIEGQYVLDAFCGTGALGLEALSRGAAFCTFVDADRSALALARANAEALGAQDRCRFIHGDVTHPERFAAPARSCGLLFLDPPYRKSLVDPALSGLALKGWAEDGAWIVVESEKHLEPDLGGSFSVRDLKIYGDTQVLFLRYGLQNPP